MTSLPPGFTTCTVPRSDCVVRKRMRMRSKWQSPLGVKARLAGVPKVTRSMTSGSRLRCWDQAKAATVARTRKAKTSAAQLTRRGIVLADDDRDGGAAGDGGDVRGHQPRFRNPQHRGDATGLRRVAPFEHHDAVGEAGGAVGHRAELEALALDLVAVGCGEARDGRPVEHRDLDFGALHMRGLLALA